MPNGIKTAPPTHAHINKQPIQRSPIFCFHLPMVSVHCTIMPYLFCIRTTIPSGVTNFNKQIKPFGVTLHVLAVSGHLKEVNQQC